MEPLPSTDTPTPPLKPPVRRRWRPRFSLRTLLLAVLLLASSAVLWWNWGPWDVVRVVNEDGDIKVNDFPPERYISYTASHRAADGHILSSRYVVRDMATLDECFQDLSQRYQEDKPYLDNPKPGEVIDFCTISETGNYAMLDRSSTLYNAQTRQFTKIKDGPTGNSDFLNNDTWVCIDYEGGIYRLPGCQPHASNLKPADGDDSESTRVNDRWVVVKRDQLLAYRIDGTKPERRWPVPPDFESCSIHDDMLFCYTKNGVILYDIPSGAALKTISGRVVGYGDSDWSRIVVADDSTNTVTVWQTTPEVKAVQAFHITIKDCCVSVFGDRAIVTGVAYTVAVYSLKSGVLLWNSSAHAVEEPAGGRFMCVVFEDGHQSILDAVTGRVLFNFSRWRWGNAVPPGYISPIFKEGSTDFLTYGFELNSVPSPGGNIAIDSGRFALWKLKRPYEWWGVAWLPEFWITTVLAVALLHSLIGDRRIR